MNSRSKLAAAACAVFGCISTSPGFASDLYLFDLLEAKSTSKSKLQKEKVPFTDHEGKIIFRLAEGQQISFGQLAYNSQGKLVRIALGHPKEVKFIKSYKQFVAFSEKLTADFGKPSLDSLMNLVTAETYRQTRTDLITPQEAIEVMKNNQATWERAWETSSAIYILKLAKHGGAHNALVVVEDIGFFNANRGLGPSPNQSTVDRVLK